MSRVSPSEEGRDRAGELIEPANLHDDGAHWLHAGI